MVQQRSGFLTRGAAGNLELVIPIARGGGLAHYWRGRDVEADPSAFWFGPDEFGTLRNSATSMIYSLYGAKERREEVIARNSSTLLFYSRDPTSRFPRWEGPITIAGGVTGTSAIIQSSNGAFHLVTPLISGGLGHYWRSISDPVTQWNGPEHFGTGTISGISMIESDYGNLELVARAGDKLVFYQRSDATWKGPYDIQSTQTGIVNSVTGDPTLIQATFGGLNHKDFELVSRQLSSVG